MEALIPENAAHVREVIARTYDGAQWINYGADKNHLASCVELGQKLPLILPKTMRQVLLLKYSCAQR